MKFTGLVLNPIFSLCNSDRKIPHCALIKWDVTPIEIVPSGALLLWLFYHGVPLPKSTKRAQIIDQVRRACQLGQELDEDRISIIDDQDKATARSYVSFDSITLLSDVNWIENGESILTLIRDQSKLPTIDQSYLDSIFGEGKNGVRLRAWLRYESGHLNIKTLRATSAKIDVNGKPEDVIIFEMKVTPCMKNVVYNVHLF